jgi:Protein of unknown function (DUF3987)/VirE N-terminal domain
MAKHNKYLSWEGVVSFPLFSINNFYMTKNIAEIKEAKMSFFDCPITNMKPDVSLTLLDVSKFIKQGLGSATNALRSITDIKEKSEYKKSKLPYVTFSGQFSTRTDRACIKHSGLICIDIDDLTHDELEMVRSFAISDKEHTLICFISPSGNGLKIIYAIDAVWHRQKDWYRGISKYVLRNCNLPDSKVDSSCSNTSRACFLCHDPDIFINPKLQAADPEMTIEVLDIGKYIGTTEPKTERGILEYEATLDNLRYFKPNFEDKNAETNFKYLLHVKIKNDGEYGSPRESWIQQLASLCNQFGMAEASTLKYVLKYFEHHKESIRTEKPIDVDKYLRAPVKDVFMRYKAQFNTWNDYNEKEAEAPLVEEDVYKELPPLLSGVCNFFPPSRERDVVFLGALGVLSSCFPSVTGIYDGKRVASNLNIFISAPASAGKGALSYARILGNSFHEKLKEEFKTQREEYEQELKEYQQGDGEGEKNAPPRKPVLKKFYIPANSSSITVIESMEANQNFGVLFDTEADTLSQTNKNDWGNFSDTVRKAFHHEDIELQRKNNSQYIHIKRSHLSIVLSGTPNQINNLLTNIENGFFSRFIFYSFPLTLVWKNVFEESSCGIDNELERISERLYKFSKRLDELVNSRRYDQIYEPLVFALTEKQEQLFNEWFGEKQKDLFDIYGPDIIASVRRLGVLAFRIAMILSTLRLVDPGEKVDLKIICSDADFNSSIKLINGLLMHTIKVYNYLRKNGRGKSFKDKKRRFYENLPDEFTRNKALETASYLEIKEKTAEHYLSQFIEQDILHRIEHNHYKKIA